MPARPATTEPRRFRWTLGRRLNLMVLAIVPLPLCVLLLLSTHQYETQLRREADLRLAARAKDSGLEVYRRLVDLEDDLRWVTREAAARPDLLLDREPWTERFRRLAWYPTGEAPAGVAEESGGGRQPYWQTRLEGGEAALVEGGGATALWIAVPGEGGGGSALWGEIELGWIWTTGALPSEGGVRWQLFGAGGRTVLASAPSAAPELEPLVAADSGGGFGALDWHSADGARWRARFATIPVGHAFGHPGLIVVVSEIDHLGAEAALLRRSTWLLAIGALIAVALVVSRRLQSQLRPLGDLLEATGRLGAGDLSARVEAVGADDLEQLGQGFNRMASELERSFHLLEAGNQVAIAALASTPVAESAAGAFVDRLGSVAPRGVELVVVLGDRKGRYHVVRHGQEREPESGGGASEPSLPLPTAVADASGWVPVERSFVPLASGRSRVASIWRPIRRGERIFGAIGLLGYSGGAEEREFLDALEGPSAQLGLAISRVHLIDELDRANWGTLTALARAVDAKSPWTRGHSERVTGISIAIGEQLGLSARDLRTLRRGALLHDVGKIGVPSAVLDKPDRLSADEVELLRSHVEKGVRILEPMEGFRDALPIVAQHHERLDGSGYPNALAGDEIHPLAALVAVADVFEALSAARPYRSARDPEFGMKFLREGVGVTFDRDCVEALERARFDGDRWPYPELAPTATRTPARELPHPPLDASWGGAYPAEEAGAESALPPSLQDRD